MIDVAGRQLLEPGGAHHLLVVVLSGDVSVGDRAGKADLGALDTAHWSGAEQLPISGYARVAVIRLWQKSLVRAQGAR